MMTGQLKILSESGMQMKGLLTTISQHQASSHAAMPSRRPRQITRLSSVLSTFSLGINMKTVGREESMYSYDKADISIISFLLEAAMTGKYTVRVISDDTDVFVLLIFWVWKLQMTASVQLDRWCGAILNIN